MSKCADYIIVGAGIVGAALALTLIQRNPHKTVIVLEREDKPAQHQTGRNSGVIHAGVYYAPGSMKAEFCRQGCEQTISFCRQYSIPFEQCGKLLVATHADELGAMHNLFARCKENGLSPEMLSKEQIARQEPHINAVAGFAVQQSGITDYTEVCQTMLALAQASGRCQVQYSSCVQQIVESGDKVTLDVELVDGTRRSFEAAQLVNCAGIYADELASRQGLQSDIKLLPFRGEYYRLAPKFDGLTERLVYPIPNPDMPFLGVHLTKMVCGYTTVGPNAVMALGREAYDRVNLSPKELARQFGFTGTWRLLWQFKRQVLAEAKTSISRRAYLALVQQYCPEVELVDLLPYRPGIRAQAVSSDGELIHDFVFAQTSLTLHVLNAPSPAATSAIPIAEHVAEKLS